MFFARSSGLCLKLTVIGSVCVCVCVCVCGFQNGAEIVAIFHSMKSYRSLILYIYLSITGLTSPLR